MKKRIGIFTALLFAVSTLIVGCKAEVHTHTFAEEWSSDETNHWHAATCGCSDVELQKTEHTFGKWEVIKEATEEAKGSKERVCDVCEYKETADIEKLEHKHKFASEWTYDKTTHWHAATCECSDVELQKTEHTFGEWEVIKEATEDAKGSKERFCDICKCKETAEIAQLNHKHVTGESWKNDDKNHWKECTGCKEKIDVKEHSYSESWTKNASGRWHACVCGEKKDFEEHTYGTWKVEQKPTASTEGTSKRECKICSFEETKQIIPIPEGFVFIQGATVTGVLPVWMDESSDDRYEGVFIEGRTVTLSDFYMGKYEVTQEEYASVMKGQKVTVDGKEYTLESNPSACTADSTRYTLFSGDEQGKRPVEGVTWYDAVWYCNALSEKEGLTKAYNIEVTRVEQTGKTGYSIYGATVTLNENANGYRLPTEAEWEYAARGGDPTATDWNYVFSGADTAKGVFYDSYKNAGLDSVGWYWYNSINGTTGDTKPSSGEQGYGTHEVGKKKANRLGLYDMSGNVFEWCYDWFGKITTTTPADGASYGSGRVTRGGSWCYYAYTASVSYRAPHASHYRSYDLGFRVVCPSSK